MHRPGANVFAWQEGYGAYTVGSPHCPAVRDYIARQEEHHRVRTFQEEYLESRLLMLGLFPVAGATG